MISVIIPLYNKAQYIKRAVESILNQSFQNFEIIIVDDGSTDDSLVIVSQLSLNDERIKVFSKKNEGVSSARNYGINKSKYNYVSFLDGDDYYHHRFLESMCLIISKYNSIELITSAVSHHNLQNDIEAFNYVEIHKRDYFKILLRYHPILSSSSTVIKKELITRNNLKFDEQLKFGEDSDFWNRCMKATESDSMILILTKLACYDINETNTSITNKNLKPIVNTYFYKLLTNKELISLKGERNFINFYVYRYYITYYKSIIALSMGIDVKNKLTALNNKLLIPFFLKYGLRDWNKNAIMKFIVYYRLLYSKSMESLPIHKHYY